MQLYFIFPLPHRPSSRSFLFIRSPDVHWFCRDLLMCHAYFCIYIRILKSYFSHCLVLSVRQLWLFLSPCCPVHHLICTQIHTFPVSSACVFPSGLWSSSSSSYISAFSTCLNVCSSSFLITSLQVLLGYLLDVCVTFLLPLMTIGQVADHYCHGFQSCPSLLTGYTFTLCGIFYFPWHRHQMEGTTGF